MPTPAEVHAQSLAALETLQPASLVWNGKTYPCLPGSAHRRKRNESGGFALEADLVLFVRAALFTVGELLVLKAGTKNTLIYDGRNWRIDEAITPAGDPFVKLLCNDPAQNTG